MPAQRRAAPEIVSSMIDSLAQGKAPGFGAKQVTALLKSSLQTERVAYLQVGRLLSLVRDDKLFAALNYATLAAYGWEQLQLCRATLYHYLNVFDWVAAHHKEWLEPGPDTFIPELNDVDDLMWIERKLAQRGLKADTKASLQAMKEKALSGKLAKSELRAFRGLGRNTGKDKRAAFLAHMEALRAEGKDLPGIPAEIVPGLDQFIASLRNALAIPQLALEEAKKAPAA